MQTQLSEIQQIIPELMSKSKSQIAKLDHTIKTQKEEIIIKEQNLNDGEHIQIVCIDHMWHNFLISGIFLIS